MKRRSLGKLRLNRETLRYLNTSKLGQVAGGRTGDPWEVCTGTAVFSACNDCQDTATCPCTASGLPGGTCNGSADFCTYAQNCHANFG